MPKKKQKAVVLISGGMDSCVTTAIAAQNKKTANTSGSNATISKSNPTAKTNPPSIEQELYALHLNYGQLTEKKELECFKEICKHYKIPKSHQLIIDISHLKQIGDSALVDKSIPLNKSGLQHSITSQKNTRSSKSSNLSTSSNQSSTQIPTSYVPFRNAHILSIAVSWAEVIKASKIYIGAVQEDSSGYPDCTAYFLRLFQKAANAGTKPETKLTIFAPLLHLTKEEIVKEGINLNAPLHLTWSCYESNKTPCQKCDSCQLRAKGFDNARVKDPILQKQ